MHDKDIRRKAQRRYTAHGFTLFKLLPGSKIPAVKGWQKLAYNPEFSTTSNYAVALQADQIVVDVDPRNFVPEVDTWSILKPILTKTFVVKTGNNGYHFYYTKPKDVKVRKNIVQLPGVDFLSGPGRYVCGVGCTHPETGRMYLPYKKSKLSDISALPDRLLSMIISADSSSNINNDVDIEAIEADDNQTVQRFKTYLLDREGAQQGNHGDEWTFKTAARGKDFGLSRTTTYRLMSAHWNMKCQPPWSEAQLKRKVDNAYDYGANKQGVEHPVNQFKPKPHDTTTKSIKLDSDKSGRPKNSFLNAYKLLTIEQFADGEPNPCYNMFQYNILANQIEYRKPPPWSIVSDYDSIAWAPYKVDQVEMKRIKAFFDGAFRAGDWKRQDLEDAVVLAASQAKYNPVVQWLETLEWDGYPRLDRWLTIYCGAKQNKYTSQIGAKTLVGAVARAFNPGVKFDYLLILEGNQGIGKSTAVSILAGDWYVDTSIKIRDKDTIQAINGYWIIEIAEMAGMRKMEIEYLKAFLSRSTDAMRPPYGRTTEDFPRKSIFIGTVNPISGGYLKDETGNRRYWPVWVEKFNLTQLKKDREQLWAEAVVRYGQGEKLYIDNSKAIQQAQLETDMRTEKHPWIYIVNEYLTQYNIQRTTLKDLYLDCINGDIKTMTPFASRTLIQVLRSLRWNSSNNVWYSPKFNKKINVKGM